MLSNPTTKLTGVIKGGSYPPQDVVESAVKGRIPKYVSTTSIYKLSMQRYTEINNELRVYYNPYFTKFMEDIAYNNSFQKDQCKVNALLMLRFGHPNDGSTTEIIDYNDCFHSSAKIPFKQPISIPMFIIEYLRYFQSLPQIRFEVNITDLVGLSIKNGQTELINFFGAGKYAPNNFLVGLLWLYYCFLTDKGNLNEVVMYASSMRVMYILVGAHAFQYAVNCCDIPQQYKLATYSKMYSNLFTIPPQCMDAFINIIDAENEQIANNQCLITSPDYYTNINLLRSLYDVAISVRKHVMTKMLELGTYDTSAVSQCNPSAKCERSKRVINEKRTTPLKAKSATMRNQRVKSYTPYKRGGKTKRRPKKMRLFL